MIGKSKIEDICRKAGMKPVARDNIMGVEVFIADGFSTPPHFAYRKFGIEPSEYPGGMYVTLWWLSKGDEKLDIGQPIFFEPFHDPSLTSAGKKRARINTAKKSAADFLKRRRMH